MAGAPILLVHAATQKPLIVEAEQRYPNEFGVEYELSARQSTGKGLKLAMEQTAKVRSEQRWGRPGQGPDSRAGSGQVVLQEQKAEVLGRQGSRLGARAGCKGFTWQDSSRVLVGLCGYAVGDGADNYRHANESSDIDERGGS